MTGALLQLLIIALGILMIVGGPKAVGWTVSAIFSPIQWILRMAIGIAVLALLAAVFLPQVAQHLPALIARQIQEMISGATTQNQPVNSDPEQVLLSGYPALGQLNASNYNPPSFAEMIDYPEKMPVKKLACLATVFVMLERDRGNPSAMIDETFYKLGVGAINPGHVANRSSEIDFDFLKRSLNSGTPVVLHGVNNRTGLVHFVLAVGYTQQKSGSLEVVINDPWRGERIGLPVESGILMDQRLGLNFSKMRTVMQ